MSDEAGGLPPGPRARIRARAPPRTPAQARASRPSPAAPADGTAGPPEGQGLNRMIISAVTQGSPAVVTTLAILLALVLGGLIIAFSDPPVLHAWSKLLLGAGHRDLRGLAVGRRRLLGVVRGRDRQPAHDQRRPSTAAPSAPSSTRSRRPRPRPPR